MIILSVSEWINQRSCSQILLLYDIFRAAASFFSSFLSSLIFIFLMIFLFHTKYFICHLSLIISLYNLIHSERSLKCCIHLHRFCFVCEGSGQRHLWYICWVWRWGGWIPGVSLTPAALSNQTPHSEHQRWRNGNWKTRLIAFHHSLTSSRLQIIHQGELVSHWNYTPAPSSPAPPVRKKSNSSCSLSLQMEYVDVASYRQREE